MNLIQSVCRLELDGMEGYDKIRKKCRYDTVVTTVKFDFYFCNDLPNTLIRM